MVTEYMSRGNMYDFIRDKRNEYDQLAMLNFAMDIARGMVYLHDQGIMQVTCVFFFYFFLNLIR